jgi:hypothetical protein
MTTLVVSLEGTMVSLEGTASREEEEEEEEGIIQSSAEIANDYINTCLVSKSIYYKKASQII